MVKMLSFQVIRHILERLHPQVLQKEFLGRSQIFWSTLETEPRMHMLRSSEINHIQTNTVNVKLCQLEQPQALT